MIAMDIWSDRHASACNSILCPLCYAFWNVQSRSLSIATDSMYVFVTSGSIVIEPSPSPNAPNFEKLEIRKGVTNKPRYGKSCDIDTRDSTLKKQKEGAGEISAL